MNPGAIPGPEFDHIYSCISGDISGDTPGVIPCIRLLGDNSVTPAGHRSFAGREPVAVPRIEPVTPHQSQPFRVNFLQLNMALCVSGTTNPGCGESNAVLRQARVLDMTIATRRWQADVAAQSG